MNSLKTVFACTRLEISQMFSNEKCYHYVLDLSPQLIIFHVMALTLKIYGRTNSPKYILYDTDLDNLK